MQARLRRLGKMRLRSRHHMSNVVVRPLPDRPGEAHGVRHGARDSAAASPNVMGLSSLGLEIGVFGHFLYRVLLLSMIWG